MNRLLIKANDAIAEAKEGKQPLEGRLVEISALQKSAKYHVAYSSSTGGTLGQRPGKTISEIRAIMDELPIDYKIYVQQIGVGA